MKCTHLERELVCFVEILKIFVVGDEKLERFGNRGHGASGGPDGLIQLREGFCLAFENFLDPAIDVQLERLVLFALRVSREILRVPPSSPSSLRRPASFPQA